MRGVARFLFDPAAAPRKTRTEADVAFAQVLTPVLPMLRPDAAEVLWHFNADAPAERIVRTGRAVFVAMRDAVQFRNLREARALIE